MYDAIALNIVKYFNYEKDRLYLLVDETYAPIAGSIEQHHTGTEIRLVQSYDFQNIEELFGLPLSAVVGKIIYILVVEVIIMDVPSQV